MGAFQKQYAQDFQALYAMPLRERAHYYLSRDLLRTKRGFTSQQERCAVQDEIQAAGMACRPFWDDEADGKKLDPEGKAFARYRRRHPTFSLMVRTGALTMLLDAQSRLPTPYRLVLKAGLRPIEVQKQTFDDYLELTRRAHPAWADDASYQYAAEFVTDPSTNLPPHATGGAVDVALWDDGAHAYADVGSPINVAEDRSWGDNHDGLAAKQIELRTLLRDVMLGAGFAPLASEWWHFSYGDQRWAVYYDKPHALYGTVEVLD